MRTRSDHPATGPLGHHCYPDGSGTLQIGTGDLVRFDGPAELRGVIAELALLHLEMTGALLPGQIAGDPEKASPQRARWRRRPRSLAAERDGPAADGAVTKPAHPRAAGGRDNAGTSSKAGRGR
jgi:hypothetical protein